MAHNEASEFGRRIALARRELGLTHKELADRIGVMLGRHRGSSQHEEPPGTPGRREHALNGRDAELEFAGRTWPEEQRRVTTSIAALEAWEGELKETTERQADEAGRLQDRQAALREREEELAEREQEVERRQAEIAAWAQTAVRVATELQGMRLTLESLRRSAEPVGAVIGPAEVELRVLGGARVENHTQRSANLDVRATAPLDEQVRELEGIRRSEREETERGAPGRADPPEWENTRLDRLQERLNTAVANLEAQLVNAKAAVERQANARGAAIRRPNA